MHADEPSDAAGVRPLRVAGKAIAVMVSAGVLLAAGTAWSTKAWYDSQIARVDALDVDSPDIVDAPVQFGAENFLIVGSDSRMGANAVGADFAAGARSDTVMLAHVPANRQRAVVVSFPRDLKITTPECPRWNARARGYTGQTVPPTGPVKLNAAYAYGGPRCVTKLVQRLTGIRVNHFVGIEFGGFKEMVDAVGGVPMTFEAPVIDKLRGVIVEAPGTTTFDGERALNLVRARYVRGDPTSDYGRIKRQQRFIAALLGTTISREVLLKPAKLSGFVNAFSASTFGENIEVDELMTLAQSLRGLDTDRVIFRTVPTTKGANVRGNEVLVKSAADRLFRAIIDNRALPREG